MPVSISLSTSGVTSGGKRVRAGELPRRELQEIMTVFGPRFTASASKRLGSLLRGSTPAAVRKRTGALRRGVKSAGTPNLRWSGQRGKIGTIHITSTGPSANRGTAGFVSGATVKASRSPKLDRALTLIARATLRKLITERDR